jgi:predicted transcriptional regulator
VEAAGSAWPKDVRATPALSEDQTEPDQELSEAIRRMGEKHIRRLPVVEAGKPVGIVSMGDLTIERDLSWTLLDISAAPPNE